MTRNEFLKSAGAATVMAVSGRGLGADALKMDGRYVELQAAIDATEAKTFGAYLVSGETKGNKALAALETAFDKVLAEVKATTVTDGRPAVWHVYNMGTVVKTREACFSIDLMHRRGHEFAPLLDFALITHNHDDHYTEPFYRAMDRAHKTVIAHLCELGHTKWRWTYQDGFDEAAKIQALGGEAVVPLWGDRI